MIEELDRNLHAPILKEPVVGARNILMWFLVETRGKPSVPHSQVFDGVNSLYFDPREADRSLDAARGRVQRVRGAYFMVTPMSVLELVVPSGSMLVLHFNTEKPIPASLRYSITSEPRPLHDWAIPTGWEHRDSPLTLEDFVLSFDSPKVSGVMSGWRKSPGGEILTGIINGDSARFFPVEAIHEMPVEDLSTWKVKSGKAEHSVYKNLERFWSHPLGCHDSFFAVQTINERIRELLPSE